MLYQRVKAFIISNVCRKSLAHGRNTGLPDIAKTIANHKQSEDEIDNEV